MAIIAIVAVVAVVAVVLVAVGVPLARVVAVVAASSSSGAVRVCDVLCFVRWLLPTCDTLVKSASQGSHVGGVRASPDDPPAAQK